MGGGSWRDARNQCGKCASRRFRFDQRTTHFFSNFATMDLSDPLVNGGSAPTNDTNASVNSLEGEDVDPIWLSSRTARQIYGLCQVEKVGTSQVPPHSKDLILYHTKGHRSPAFTCRILHLTINTASNRPSGCPITPRCRTFGTIRARSQ